MIYGYPHIVNCEKEEYHKITAAAGTTFTVNHTPFFSSLATQCIIELENYTTGATVAIGSFVQSTGVVNFTAQTLNDEMLITYKWGTGYTFAYNPQNTSIELREVGNVYEILDGSKSYDGITVKHDIGITGENMNSAMKTNLDAVKTSMRLQFYTHEDAQTFIVKVAKFNTKKKQGTGRDEYIYDYDLALEES